MKKDCVILTQSSLSTGRWLLGFLEVGGEMGSHIYTDRDRGRRITKATATLEGGRLHTPLFYSVQRVYVLTLHCACRGDRSSSHDTTSIVGGALARPFQPLRNEIDHHIPPCTALVWEEEPSPTYKGSKGIYPQRPRMTLGPEAWQDCRSLPLTDTPTRRSLRPEICRAF